MKKYIIKTGGSHPNTREVECAHIKIIIDNDGNEVGVELYDEYGLVETVLSCNKGTSIEKDGDVIFKSCC